MLSDRAASPLPRRVPALVERRTVLQRVDDVAVVLHFEIGNVQRRRAVDQVDPHLAAVDRGHPEEPAVADARIEIVHLGRETHVLEDV